MNSKSSGKGSEGAVDCEYPADKSAVLLVDLARVFESVRQEMRRAIDTVGERGIFILGPEVEAFEAAFAALVSSRYATACASGTDAIELALRAGGLRSGQEVATTPLTAFATTTAIVRAGGIPVFLEIDRNGNLDIMHLSEWASSEAGRFAVAVHLYGNPMDLDALSSLRSSGLVVIEDCAQAHFARWRGRHVGSAGQFGAFSFYPTKNLPALGDAGAVVTESSHTRDRLQRLRNYGQETKYEHVEFGINSRMDELHAAIMRLSILPLVADWTHARISVARRYLAAIENEAIGTLAPFDVAEPSWHLFPVFVDPSERQGFRAWLQTRGIQTGLHYPTVIPDQKATASFPFQVPASLDRARKMAHSEVSLPIHPFLTAGEVERVIEACNTWRPSPTSRRLGQ